MKKKLMILVALLAVLEAAVAHAGQALRGTEQDSPQQDKRQPCASCPRHGEHVL